MDDVIYYTQIRNILRYLYDNDLDGGIPKKIKSRVVHETCKRYAKSKLKELPPTKTISLVSGQKVTSC